MKALGYRRRSEIGMCCENGTAIGKGSYSLPQKNEGTKRDVHLTNIEEGLCKLYWNNSRISE